MHTYIHPETGAELPSVTTILEDTMPDEQRFQLGQYYAKGASSYIKNIESQRRGIAVDAWAKAYLLDRSYEIDYQFMPWCQQLRPLLDALRFNSDALLIDEFVYTHEYAGMLDVAACVAGRWTVLDIKTKSHIYLPAIESHKLQVAAYAHALRFSRGYSVTGIGILVATKTKCESIRVDSAAELQAISQAWQARLSQFTPCCHAIPQTAW